MTLAVPAVEVADDTHRASVRRPHRERGAGRSVHGAHVRAEHVPQLLVTALADQMQIELADRRQMAIRVVGDEVRAVRVGRGELVASGPARAGALPDAGPGVLERHAGAVGEHCGDARRERPAGPDDPLLAALRVGFGVDAEHRVRVVVRAGRDGVENLVGWSHLEPFTWRMWTGSANASSITKL